MHHVEQELRVLPGRRRVHPHRHLSGRVEVRVRDLLRLRRAAYGNEWRQQEQ